MMFMVSYAEFILVAAEMSPTKTVLYVPDTTNAADVGAISILDPKLGGALFAFSVLPTIAQLLIDFPGAIKVTAIL